MGPTSRGNFSFSGKSARDLRAAVKVIRGVGPWKPILPSSRGEDGRGCESHGDGLSRQLPALSSRKSNQGVRVRRGDREPGVCVYAELRTTKLFLMYLQNWMGQASLSLLQPLFFPNLLSFTSPSCLQLMTHSDRAVILAPSPFTTPGVISASSLFLPFPQQVLLVCLQHTLYWIISLYLCCFLSPIHPTSCPHQHDSFLTLDDPLDTQMRLLVGVLIQPTHDFPLLLK